MKFAICNEIFQGWPIEAVLSHCASLGYDGVEIAPFTLGKTAREITPATRRVIRETAAGLGLEICGLHWLLARTEGMSLTHADPGARKRTSGYLCELVDCCADLGGKVLVLGSPQQRNVPPELTQEQAWEFATEVLRPVARRAEDRHAVLCFEPLSPAETNFINTAAEAIRFTAQFQSPAMKIILDVKAMCAEETPIPEIIRQSWPRFAHFHANDKNLKGPGFGQVDFKPIARALLEVGYQDFVSVEVFNFEEGPEAIASRSLAYLRDVFALAAASSGGESLS
jgi:sugar phosphate isomerase/epimerase